MQRVSELIFVFVAFCFYQALVPTLALSAVNDSDWTPVDHPERFSYTSTMRLDDGTVTNTLRPGDELSFGQGLMSPDKRFMLQFQPDGNMVFYYKNRPLWSTATLGKGGTVVRFQADGNFVMYKADGKSSVWSSGTNNQGAVALRLSNDGNLAIYSLANVALWTSNTCCFPPAEAGDKRPIAVGKWGEKMDWPIIPIHSVLLPSGKLFTFGSDRNGLQGAQLFYDIWDPAQGGQVFAHETLPNTLETDIFCAAPILFPYGKDVIIAGGDGRIPPYMNKGIRDTTILKTDNQTLARGPYMVNARWYATATALPNGEIFVSGGTDPNGTIPTPEVYSPEKQGWRSLFGATSSEIVDGDESKWFYPRNFVAPDGRIFGMTGNKMYYIDTKDRGSVEIVQDLPSISRSYTSSAVMYQPGKILQMGGTFSGNIAARTSDGVIDVDINGDRPSIKKLNPMAFERAWHQATVLPNGEVLVTGGSARENQLIDPAFTAELWNPTTQKFRPLVASPIARLYHSTAILLPDATVFVGGGGAPGPLVNTNAEIYYPPYLFDEDGNEAPRPSIGIGTSREDYDHRSNYSFAGASIPTRIVLVKTGAVTHSFDFEQRFIPLNFTVQGNTVNVRMPKNANLAPPGHYLLFMLNAAGVPSVAKIISLGAPRDRSILLPGDVLSVGDSLQSADGRLKLMFHTDGNLALSINGRSLWKTETSGLGAVKVQMREDGNLVVLNARDEVLWQTETASPENSAAKLILQDDGNMVLSKEETGPFWSSATCCR